MTKQQLIDALASKFTKVANESTWKLIATTAGVDLVEILVFKQTGEAMYGNNIRVWRDGSNYYWQNGEPEKSHFYDRVITFVNAKIADATVKFAVIKDINDANKKATITAIMPDKSTKTVILTESTENNFAIEAI